MVYQVAAPVLIAFAISALLGPIIIPFLRKLKVGQTEREELKYQESEKAKQEAELKAP